MSNQLFSERDIVSDSPRIAWVKRLGLQVWRTPIDGLCECPETGEEIKAWSCCTIQELDRLSIRAVGTGDTEEEACVEWARKHHEPLWNEEDLIDDHDREQASCCDRCGGDGYIEYIDGDGGDWGEDCPSEENHLIICRACGGTGYAK